ncbi:4Fe-4S dicluster domain-containing protein [Guyparkeria sp. SCN-R1]|uniref:(Fe-S)-binding protein n=1 Tax=Guyparkeria sp. SCN-R1 TaxID=2341113 RepID=UPI000F651775|nr:heterodisulfide reductase-related iron-sulfur binding cluster [Guyparkeria sp. SCN-R1]RRQ23283.1 4Fe-4S dicluster domain-containing protein [Guyparkeria sp. SCN-R1]
MNSPNPTASAGQPPSTTLDQAIQSDALDCVMCGICVPHCPTFSLTHNEADGPRGRISLLLGISQGELPPDADVSRHLDTCLTCRACETVCPSGVAYGRLIDNGRTRLAQESAPATHPRGEAWFWRLLRDQLLTRRRRLGMAWQVYRGMQRLGLGGMARRLAGPMGRALPRQLSHATPPQASTQEPKSYRGRVGLFMGCTGAAMNAPAVAAARAAITAFGYQPVIPRDQICCGAMHAHSGEPEAAARQRERNAAAFKAAGVDEIIVVGTACSAELAALPASHGLTIREITEWLLEREPAEWPRLARLDHRVALHTPCSQRNHLAQPDVSRRLLEAIPGLELLEIDGNARCCGAAGMHVLLYPEQAERLREPKLASIKQLAPDLVVSANVGCATHLAAGAKLVVKQPVELLAESIAAASR